MTGGANGSVYRTSGGKNGGEAPELWGREFGDHKGEPITLGDGTAIEVGQSFRDPGFYVEEGKVRTRNGFRATAGYYFVPALDSLDFGRVEYDAWGSTVYVEGPDGVLSAYDYASGTAADENGADDLTHGMAAAVLYGEYERARVAVNSGAHDLLQAQYAEVFEAFRHGRTLANLIRATDGHYALLKGRGGEIRFGDAALTVRTADVAESRRAGTPAGVDGAEGFASDLLVELDPDLGFTPEHEKLARVAGLAPFGGDLGEAGKAFVPAPDPAFVLTDAAALVAEEIAFSRSIGNRSYQVIGEPSAGKNYLLRQMSAVEGRPHLEIDASGETDLIELLGAPTIREGSMVFLTGKITGALEWGWRVVLNEANAVDRELLTVLHNVVGSGNSVEDRVVVVSSPESERTVVPVHEDADLVFTFNPEGTAEARRLPRALASRMPCRVMEAPSPGDAARVVAAQANRMLSRRGPGSPRVDDAAARAAWEFYRQLRALAADPATSQGFERAPDARWVHRFAAEQAVRGERALSLAREIFDHDADAEEDRGVARETVRDLYSRCYGSGYAGRRAA